MLTAECLRNSMQPLGMNNSMNIQMNDSASMNTNFGGFGSSSQDRVPVDRPLFVNTSMTTQQRVDLYRRLCEPIQDSEPALQMRF
ncbi:hypothetical protein WR25_14546 [Diploscapter pachys]|uniref:Uncharacterized protein n=1 Tax=Diploscapter pachys TaxID=2018661 RepID=A0A2A2L4S5_9BILA|nr:hypothetical protein WR25_14546 [Diploscapter pachys]